MAKSRMVICPYCGETQSAGDKCRACGGLFDALSRQATHNDMGPWFIRSQARPHQPGCSYETLIKLVERGTVTKHTVLRGPTTKQFWTIAKRVPGVAHVLGFCHQCDATVDPSDHGCHACGVAFGAYLDRNYLGLPEVRPLPWEAPDVSGTDPAQEAWERDRRWSHAGGTVGVSSFVSDAELMGVAGGSSYAESGGMGTAVLAARTSAPSHFDETMAAPVASQADTEHNTAAMRAMQRRILDMQRTMRMLMIGLAVVCIVALLLVVRLMVAGGTSGPGTAGTGDSGAQTNTPTPTPAGTTDLRTTSDATSNEIAPAEVPANVDGAPVNVPNQTSADASTSSGGIETDPNATSAHAADRAQIEADARAAMAEAQTLFERARDDATRPIDDRIADAEQAARVLKAVNPSDVAEASRADFTRMVADVDRLVEKLKLQKFFP